MGKINKQMEKKYKQNNDASNCLIGYTVKRSLPLYYPAIAYFPH